MEPNHTHYGTDRQLDYGIEAIILKCDKLIISRLGPITMTSEISSRRAWYRVGNRVGTKIITMYTQES